MQNWKTFGSAAQWPKNEDQQVSNILNWNGKISSASSNPWEQSVPQETQQDHWNGNVNFKAPPPPKSWEQNGRKGFVRRQDKQFQPATSVSASSAQGTTNNFRYGSNTHNSRPQHLFPNNGGNQFSQQSPLATKRPLSMKDTCSVQSLLSHTYDQQMKSFLGVAPAQVVEQK